MSLDFNICISADILPISCEGSTPASSNLCSSLSLLDFLLFALFCRLCSLVNLFPSGSVALVIASFSDSLSALKIVETSTPNLLPNSDNLEVIDFISRGAPNNFLPFSVFRDLLTISNICD